jgi:hypothetical protein
MREIDSRRGKQPRIAPGASFGRAGLPTRQAHRAGHEFFEGARPQAPIDLFGRSDGLEWVLSAFALKDTGEWTFMFIPCFTTWISAIMLLYKSSLIWRVPWNDGPLSA